MKKRLPTSAFILICTLGFVMLRQFSLLFFDAFATVIMVGAIFEVARIQKKQNKKISFWILFCVPVAEVLIFNLACCKNILIYNLIFVLLACLYLLTEEIFSYGKNRKLNINQDATEINAHLFDKTKNTMLVFAYPILPLSFLFAINHFGYDFGYVGIILSFAVAMMTDSFAYLVGCAFGKKRFIPEVSPKKSIAGVIGGFLGGIIAAAVCFVLFYYTPWFASFAKCDIAKLICGFVIIGVVGSYANQLGDLVASAYKRKAGIKDFSNIFPGHGGFMDRVDGLMFVTIVVYIVLSLFFV